MTDFLFNLFSIDASDAGAVSGWAVRFHGLNPVYLLLTAILLAALVVWMYRRSAADVPPLRKYLLATLRTAFLVLLLGLLLRPVLRITYESSIRRTLLVLLDTSASMGEIKDQRMDENDRKRLAIARGLLEPSQGLSQPLPLPAQGAGSLSRIEVVKAAFHNGRLNLVETLSRDYDLGAYAFDRALADLPALTYRAAMDDDGSVVDRDENPPPPLSAIDNVEARGAYSAIGDAIREVISRKRGQPLAGVLLITDGVSNSGAQPLDAARLAGQDRVPLYIWGVGITSPKDIVVSSLFSPDMVFARDEVPVRVHVGSRGMKGQLATVTLRFGEETVEKQIEFNADGEQVVSLSLTPKKQGEFDLVASVTPHDDEVVKDNNSRSQRVKVIDEKIKVLMIEQSPRWEFKYLQAILLRDRRVSLKCVLFEADPDLATERNSPYLPEVPRREDLFKYDVVILGDVESKAFSVSQLEAIHEFVHRFGGSLVVLAGKRNALSTYRRTSIEKMLPVELESTADIGPASVIANKPIQLELSPAGRSGRSAAMLRLAPTAEESAAVWAKLPPVYWVARAARAKPAAEVLVVDPDPAKASRFGKMPVIAMQQYSRGHVLYLGTDNLWRWRKNVGDRHHTALWGQMIQRMALPKLLGGSKRTQMSLDQKIYETGRKATVIARLYTESFEPITEQSMRAYYIDSDTQTPPREVTLRLIPDQPGMYKGEFVAPNPGSYRLGVEHDTAALEEFTVTEPKLEFVETAMNQPVLEQMASTSGGAFFREEDLHTLPSRIGAKRERKETTSEVELWSSPAYFLLMMLVVSSEWILRKMVQLK